MSFFSLCCVKFFILVSILSLAASVGTTRSHVRRGLQNLIRVGKRFGEDELLWESEDKRFPKLMVFPRIGRSSTSWSEDENAEKRKESNTGMWFGPRIGRSPSDLADTTLWAYIFWNSDRPQNRQIHTRSPEDEEAELIQNENNKEDSLSLT